MTARIATNLLFGLLISTIATGCVHQQRSKQSVVAAAFSADEAPKVDLVVEGAPIISTVSNRLEPTVIFSDDRPPLEKQFYPGETNPNRWRDAVTILPLESFQPGFEKTARKAILDSLQDALRYETVSIHIQSFHVALDERDRGEEELLYDYKNWDDDRQEKERLDAERKAQIERSEREIKRTQRELGLPTSAHNQGNDDSFGDKVIKGIWNATVVTPIKKRNQKIERDRQLAVAPQTLPTELTDNKRSGWNCQLQLEVSLKPKDKPARTVSMTATSYAKKTDSTSVESQMQQVVIAAIKDVAAQLKSEAL